MTPVDKQDLNLPHNAKFLITFSTENGWNVVLYQPDLWKIISSVNYSVHQQMHKHKLLL
jgi:hypothetical protein